MSARTFKLTSPHMTGEDVRNWQRELVKQFARMGIAYPLEPDGDYGVTTRSATASLCHALGMTASDVMADGVTPALRTRLRNRRLNPWERIRMGKRVAYRRALRRRHGTPENEGGVASPVAKIIEDSWGYHPPVHDGLDVICPAGAPLHAMCDGEIVRVSASGWWGKGAPADPALKAKGDGVIVLRCGVTTGPFKRGVNIVYGHAEGACVRQGQIVRAGQRIGTAGFANAWHIHLAINGRTDTLGVGDRDPRPFLNYAVKNG